MKMKTQDGTEVEGTYSEIKTLLMEMNGMRGEQTKADETDVMLASEREERRAYPGYDRKKFIAKNRSKVLPPSLKKIGATDKTAWTRDKVIRNLISDVLTPGNTEYEFSQLIQTKTLIEAPNGKFRAPYGVTRQ